MGGGRAGKGSFVFEEGFWFLGEIFLISQRGRFGPSEEFNRGASADFEERLSSARPKDIPFLRPSNLKAGAIVGEKKSPQQKANAPYIPQLPATKILEMKGNSQQTNKFFSLSSVGTDFPKIPPKQK